MKRKNLIGFKHFAGKQFAKTLTHRFFPLRGLGGFLLVLWAGGFSPSVSANDTIRFVNRAGRGFGILTTAGKFTVDWGGMAIDTITGNGTRLSVSNPYVANEHTVTIAAIDTNCRFIGFTPDWLITLDLSGATALEWFTCIECGLTSIDLSKNTALQGIAFFWHDLASLDISKNIALERVDCVFGPLTALDISNNTALKYVDCSVNRLQLSNLYEIYKMVDSADLGLQRAPSLEAFVGNAVDFSYQAEFEGIPTAFFNVKKNDVPTSWRNYTIANGMITFHDTGRYSVTMTNAAINSYHEVITEFYVMPKTVNISEATQELFKIYPTPTTGQVRISNYELRANEHIQLYNTVGELVLLQKVENENETKIDISHLSAGVYFLQMNGITKKIIKY